MRLPTVWLERKERGKLRRKKVNAIDYATDLGRSRFAGWRLVSEQHGDKLESTQRTDGVHAKVSAEEIAVMERPEKETAGYKAAQSRQRRRRQPDVEVIDKEE